MALTPEGTPYVEASDLVASYPAASLALANRVDLVGVLPFATSAARATAIPSPTDGQYSYLQDTNTTQFWNGTAWQTAGGKILQVVSVAKTDTFSASVVSGAEVLITGLAVSITPTSNTSKILIQGFATGSASDNFGNSLVSVKRNGTLVGIADAAGSRVRLMSAVTANANGNADLQSSPMHFLDSPATISALTYQIFLNNTFSATRTIFLNRAADDTDNNGRARTISVITVMEVSA